MGFERVRRRLSRWAEGPLLLVLIAGVGALISGQLYLDLLLSAREHIDATVQSAADRALSDAARHLDVRLKALSRMSERSNAATTSREEWEVDASGILRDFGGFEALAWIDASRRVQWVIPRAPNEHLIGMDLSVEPHRREVLARAEREGRPAHTGVIRLLNGRSGIVFAVPAHGAGALSGFVVGIFQLEDTFERLLDVESREKYGFELYDRERLLLAVNAPRSDDLREHMVRRTIPPLGLELRVIPLLPHHDATRSHTPEQALGGSLILTSLVLVATALAQRNLRLARRAQGFRAQLVDAIEGLDSGFAMFDPDERLVVANSRFAELHEEVRELVVPGVRFDELMEEFVARAGGHSRRLTDEDLNTQALTLVTGANATFDQKLPRRWLRVSDRPTREGGLVSLRTDVTAIKQTEHELREAKESAEAATRAKSEFLATMSHEIRTPMNGVIGMLDLVLDSRLTPKQRDELRTARGSAEALLAIINDILDFSKVEAGHLQLEAVGFSLRDQLGEMLRPLAVQARTKGVELMFQVESDVPDALVGDPLRLRQVVLNLVSNALKFTARGEVLVGVALDERIGADVSLRFTVADTGPGLSAEARSKLFKPFEQGDASTSRRFGGTGLGLAICAQLVDLMFGRIWVDSRLGEGSQFHFTARFGIGAAAAKDGGESFEVLVVEDHPRHRLVLQRMLAGWTLVPRVVPDVQTALEVLAKAASVGAPIPVIVVDAELPDDGAARLAEALWRRKELAATAVVWASDSGGPPPRIPGRSERLAKPLVASALCDALARVRDQELAEVAGPSPSQAKEGLRVLAVDDNEVNRRVAQGLLEREGHRVESVADGPSALAALEHSEFDLVLLDIQMPGMDGFEVCRLIREREETPGVRRVAIIALTAQAMKEDRQRCLDAGMDGYVSKPIDRVALRTAIAGLQLLPSATPAAANEPTSSGPGQDSSSPVDRAELWARVCESPELLREIIGMFLADLRGMREAVGHAVTDAQPQAVLSAAHRLRGVLLNMAAGPAARLADRLESLARSDDLGEAPALHRQLERELDRVVTTLEEWSRSTLETENGDRLLYRLAAS